MNYTFRIGKFCFLLLFTFSFAYSTWAINDPQAKNMLDEVKANMLSTESWEFEFELTVRFPEMEADKMKGVFYQDGKKFKVDLGEQIVISDGQSIYTYIKDFNEVQISDYDNGIEEMFINPSQIIQIYENGEYLYQYSGKTTFQNREMHLIEFKPSNPAEAEYIKIKLLLDMKAKMPAHISISARNGANYQLELLKQIKGANHPPSVFQFRKEDFPGVEVEDLRLK